MEYNKGCALYCGNFIHPVVPEHHDVCFSNGVLLREMSMDYLLISKIPNWGGREVKENKF